MSGGACGAWSWMWLENGKGLAGCVKEFGLIPSFKQGSVMIRFAF